MLASSMFSEVPNRPPDMEDPTNNKQVRNYHHMLVLFNVIIQEKPPIWNKTEYSVGLIDFPFNAILDWPMGTPSAYAFFLDSDVNKAFKAVLNKWKDDFLTKNKSRSVQLRDLKLTATLMMNIGTHFINSSNATRRNLTLTSKSNLGTIFSLRSSRTPAKSVLCTIRTNGDRWSTHVNPKHLHYSPESNIMIPSG
jgi:hypothetical protein